MVVTLAGYLADSINTEAHNVRRRGGGILWEPFLSFGGGAGWGPLLCGSHSFFFQGQGGACYFQGCEVLLSKLNRT